MPVRGGKIDVVNHLPTDWGGGGAIGLIGVYRVLIWLLWYIPFL